MIEYIPESFTAIEANIVFFVGIALAGLTVFSFLRFGNKLSKNDDSILESIAAILCIFLTAAFVVLAITVPQGILFNEKNARVSGYSEQMNNLYSVEFSSSEVRRLGLSANWSELPAGEIISNSQGTRVNYKIDGNRYSSLIFAESNGDGTATIYQIEPTSKTSVFQPGETEPVTEISK